MNLNSKFNFHYVFLGILSLNYIVPLILFDDVTLFYHDALDHEIVYNKFIGKLWNGDLNSINIFLNGEIKIEYLRRLFHPLISLYSFLNTELAYWITDCLVKLTSYISFFILSKKINKNLFYCGLAACLYASANLPTHEGFGLAILPYLTYLIIYKENLKIKHILILIFFGLNSDLVVTGISLIPVFFFLLLILNKEKYLNCIKVLLLFCIPLLLININLILIILRGDEIHRIDFYREHYSLAESIVLFINSIFQIPKFQLNFTFLLSFPRTLLILPLMIIFIFFKEKNVFVPIVTIILTYFILSFLTYQPIADLTQNYELIKKLNWSYMEKSLLFLYLFSTIWILKKKKFFTKLLSIFLFLIVLSYQFNSSVVPFVKQKFLKIENYQNLYTFKGYYDYFNYSEIIKITKNNRTLSIGVDPMVAAYHNIKVSDGYHNIYPLSYKKKFRKIIEPELQKNSIFRKYYDEWGSRVYTTLYEPFDKENIQLNFQIAKELGVKFIISKYPIKSNQILLLKDNCIYQKNKLCLYSIY